MDSMEQEQKNATWNYHPDTPIKVSPLFSWPPNPFAWIKWISKYWLAVSSITLELLAAFIIYQWFQPSWESMQTLSLNWVVLIWIRNLILLTLFAGSLHLWFITFAVQGKNLKFDKRDQNRNNRTYSFRNQVWDNIFWSCVSGVSAWTIWGSFLFLGSLLMVLHQELHLPATQFGLVIWLCINSIMVKFSIFIGSIVSCIGLHYIGWLTAYIIAISILDLGREYLCILLRQLYFFLQLQFILWSRLIHYTSYSIFILTVSILLSRILDLKESKLEIKSV